MSTYPDVDDDDFYEKINKKFAKDKIPQKKKSLKEICFPKSYELQIPQKFLADFMNPKTPYKGLLVYHKIGGGKTCVAVNIAEGFKHHKNIVVVLPASLKGNFRSELRTPCAGNNYIKDTERAILKKHSPSDQVFKDIIRRSDERIDKFYTIYSYNKFVDLIQAGKMKLTNTLLIIDEVHNMISETGTYYENIYNAVMSAPKDLRLVLMTATPIFDKPNELALTINLLNKKNQMPTGTEFYDVFLETKYTSRGITYEPKNMDLFKSYIKGYVSYYKGAPSHVFPDTILKIVKCEMSDKQYHLYRKIIAKESKSKKELTITSNISNSFFIGTRMVSNIMYPNEQINEDGYESLRDRDLDTDRIGKYSPKFLKILRKIKSCRGTVFVYSNFKEYGGIKPFIKLLEHHNYKNYEGHGQGRKRFAVWSGDQTLEYKEEIKVVFNKKDNEDGSKIKIIIGSSAIKEGVSLLRVQQVHMMEPYWNWSRMDQIMGRAIRYCSHKDVEEDKRIVRVYIYLSVHPALKMSIDEKIMQIAIQKKKISLSFERALKEAAIDCELFYNANNDGESNLVCDT